MIDSRGLSTRHTLHAGMSNTCITQYFVSTSLNGLIVLWDHMDANSDVDEERARVPVRVSLSTTNIFVIMGGSSI